MARKIHDIDARMMHSTNRIVENVKEGASPDAIALLLDDDELDGPFVRKLIKYHAANKTKPAYTKRNYKNTSRVTKEVLAEKMAEPVAELPTYPEDLDAITCKFEE
ncbi:hypothetical protein [Xanthomonas campestris]|uniref:hypothetical protein n=1 Tax=Xanthomonas campestris TaxID=339 RepID=UPI001CD3122B|nr:hypothetical protein [Xanthomonas campestris]MEA9923027.1 hypothetical protein [Xanthomonas campestris pv. raphani]